MPSGEISYRFLWQFEASPEALWPYVADTNRFNRETGAPEVVPDPGGSPAPGVRRLRLRAAGRSIPFEEAPFEWVRPRPFGRIGDAPAFGSVAGHFDVLRRIVGLSGGQDVVVSGTVRDDPEVAAKLAGGAVEIEPIEAVLKGFDDTPFELWRVRRAR